MQIITCPGDDLNKPLVTIRSYHYNFVFVSYAFMYFLEIKYFQNQNRLRKISIYIKNGKRESPTHLY